MYNTTDNQYNRLHFLYRVYTLDVYANHTSYAYTIGASQKAWLNQGNRMVGARYISGGLGSAPLS